MKLSQIKSLIQENHNQILLERFVNLFDKNEIGKYIDTIWDILERTYEPIGGFHSANNKEDLIDKTYLAKLVKKNDKIIAVALYSDKFGRKTIAKGSDGSVEGKQAVKLIYLEDVKHKRAWGEFSGAAEKLMLKYGGVPIPNTLAKDILKKPIISLSPDGFHYYRDINGHKHEKIIIGNLENQ